MAKVQGIPKILAATSISATEALFFRVTILEIFSLSDGTFSCLTVVTEEIREEVEGGTEEVREETEEVDFKKGGGTRVGIVEGGNEIGTETGEVERRKGGGVRIGVTKGSGIDVVESVEDNVVEVAVLSRTLKISETKICLLENFAKLVIPRLVAKVSS